MKRSPDCVCLFVCLFSSWWTKWVKATPWYNKKKTRQFKNVLCVVTTYLNLLDLICNLTPLLATSECLK